MLSILILLCLYPLPLPLTSTVPTQCQPKKCTSSEDQVCPLDDQSNTDWPLLLKMAKYSEMTASPDEDSQSEDNVHIPYVPRIRSPIARAMYERMLDNEEQRSRDHSEWYAVDTSSYPDHIKALFQQCYQDRGTLDFLDNCYEKSDWVLTQMYHGFMKSVLTWFMSVTSANGFLGRGSMFVFSGQQFRRLMKIDETFKAQFMIDLGAGDGKVTETMAVHYEQVYATEVSTWMQSRLREVGYSILNIEEWAQMQYDLISCLNLLDRCERPLALLEDIKRSLKPGGKVVVAVVLPYVPYVENVRNHQAVERLPVKGRTFSEQLLSLVQDVFQPIGFDVVSFTHLPYLCEGDIYRSFYVLNDAVFVLKLK